MTPMMPLKWKTILILSTFMLMLSMMMIQFNKIKKIKINFKSKKMNW
uniref:ATP synthase F0 subunit 8 n=1 Tax=Didesmococcus koreanus TaxID=1661411 RepID=A0A891H0D5_9HEMI|nr:ATP synthase F0 subunit 8 [Didesmococcus koreanus]QRK27452.1 ATP synthase F0 subunit 8 [Didesmococcus koreanus]